MRLFIISILLLFYSSNSFALSYKTFKYGWTNVKIRMGSHAKKRSDKATMVFFIGYADRMENHDKLFAKLRRRNIRVVSYDYPGHGESGGWLATWGIKATAQIAKSVVKLANVDSTKPVILAGWSTGGLIAVRTIQSWTTSIIPAKYDIAGAILIAPAIPAKVFVGTKAVVVNDLTRGKMKHGPKPKTTLAGGAFTISLAKQAFQARRLGSLPNDIPVVVYLGDKNSDKYATASSTKSWIKSESQKPIWGFECPTGYHGLEFEPFGIGRRVLEMTATFAQKMASPAAKRIRRTKNAVRNFGRQASACPAIQ